MAKLSPVNVQVERTIAASPHMLYDMVSDVTRMGEWSPETVEAHWLGGATGPSVGAKFKGKNQSGPNTWSTKPTVTKAEPGQVFEFKVPGKAGPTWRYNFRADGDATVVSESVEQDHGSPWFIKLLQKRAGITDRQENLQQSMTTTLARLDAAATNTTSATPASNPTATSA